MWARVSAFASQRHETHIRHALPWDFESAQRQLSAGLFERDRSYQQRAKILPIRLLARNAIVLSADQGRIVSFVHLPVNTAAVETDFHSRSNVLRSAGIVNLGLVLAAMGDLDVPRHPVVRTGPVRKERAVGRTRATLHSASGHAITRWQHRAAGIADGEGTVVLADQRQHLF